MDSLPFADALVKEYLLFRGFTRTLDTFCGELELDAGCGYQAARISTLLFGTLIPELRMGRVMELLELLNARLYVHLDERYDSTLRTLEQSIIKCMLVTAVKLNRPDKVDAFFRQWGGDLLQGPDGHLWREWCALSFVQQPWQDPTFQVHFLTEWTQLLETSFCNFLSQVVSQMPLPALLRFNTDRRARLQLAKRVESLSERLRDALAAAKPDLSAEYVALALSPGPLNVPEPDERRQPTAGPLFADGSGHLTDGLQPVEHARSSSGASACAPASGIPSIGALVSPAAGTSAGPTSSTQTSQQATALVASSSLCADAATLEKASSAPHDEVSCSRADTTHDNLHAAQSSVAVLSCCDGERPRPTDNRSIKAAPLAAASTSALTDASGRSHPTATIIHEEPAADSHPAAPWAQIKLRRAPTSTRSDGGGALGPG